MSTSTPPGRPSHPSTGAPLTAVPDEDRHAVERIRRSVAMLPPGQKALTREDAMVVLSRLDRAETQIDHLRAALEDVLGRP
ncbi:MAG: hypothetical protein ACR2QE_09560 [Acidimicrobiales bacterium]